MDALGTLIPRTSTAQMLARLTLERGTVTALSEDGLRALVAVLDAEIDEAARALLDAARREVAG